MKKRVRIVVCLLAVLLFSAGCGAIKQEEDASEVSKYSISKEDYLKDIEMVLNMSSYLEYSEDNIEKMLKTMKQVDAFTTEGDTIKGTMLRVLELSKVGLELTGNMTENNFETSLKKYIEIQTEMEELMGEKLLFAAQKAGVDSEDLQVWGLE